MLLSLHIRDFAIIDELEVDWQRGMTALTGETGAGKSILLDALGLLLGDRADAAAVRHGAERAEISAGFDSSAIPAAQAWLTEQELDLDDECQLRRVIHRQGRSRAYINGSPVPIQSLRELGEHLVDIHGQHEHQSLMQRDLQRRLLDDHGGHQELLKALSEVCNEYRQTRQAIDTIVGNGQDRESRVEFLQFQLQELNELAPEAGESRRLHEEQARLSHAEQLIQTCEKHIARLHDDDECSAQNTISQALNELEPLARIDPALSEASELINNALIQLQEAVHQLRTYQQGVELDPQRLSWVEQRLDALHKVAAKHRMQPEELVAFQSGLNSELQQLADADQRLEALEQRQRELEQNYRELARQLHERRCETATQLSHQVTDTMQTLGMHGGEFRIQVQTKTEHGISPQGRDHIEFLVSANPGQPPQALTRVASGGELSRISLAIQVVATQDSPIPTLIFDEVDSGIGGAVAETVGHQLRILGQQRQVLCVTHLPQVAAQAHQHLQVRKLTGENTTRTRVRALPTKERVEEIARMLGGRKITDSTLQHAEEMLRHGATDGESAFGGIRND